MAMELSVESEPLETLLGSVSECLASGIYYAALVVALTIPEICSALESEGGRGSGERYKVWYATYLGDRYPDLTPDDCYRLRCGVLHQGRLGRPDMLYSRVIFTIPNASENVLHNNVLGEVLNLDVSQFCDDLVSAARRWYKVKAPDPHVIANLPNLVRYRPEGLSPYVVGMPLIA
jgi:hypothetical protein